MIKFFRSPGEYKVDDVVELDYTMEKYWVDKLFAEYVEAQPVPEEKPKAKRTKKEADE